MEHNIAIEESAVEEKKSKKGILITTGILLIILISYMLINAFNNKYIYNGKISENIYIQGINVSGLTVDEAKKKVEKEFVPKDMNISYGDNKFIIKPSEIDFNYNIAETVNEAYNFNKTDSYFQNVKRFILLKKGNKEEFELKSIYSENKLNDSIEKIAKDVNKDVKDAKLYISGSGAMSVDPSQIGKKVDINENKNLIANSIKNKDFKGVGLIVKETQPKITTDMVNSVNSVLAQHSTSYASSSAARAHNITKAANSTSDILLMPGEEYSYNGLTGPRSKSNGYKDAPVIVNGKLEDGSGGGVCQVSTTIYDAALYAGLDITQVRNHSLPSTYAEMGKDATVAYDYLDLKFKNPYDTPIYIKNTTYNGIVSSRIYGNASDKKNISITTEKHRSGNKSIVKTYRKTKDSSGKVLKNEFIATSTYKMK